MKSHCGFFITPFGAKRKCAYILSATHKNHARKEIKSRQIGSRSEFEIELAVAAHGDGKIRRGRKQKYSAVELVGSTPKGCGLTEQERRKIENAVVEELDICSCLLVWHIDKDDGRNDFHLITPNRDSRGLLLTARDRGNLLYHFRTVMDRVHDAINQARKQAGGEHIETMPEARARIRQKGRAELVLELSKAEIPLKREAIVEWLRGRGQLSKRCRVNGDAHDYVSVIYIPKRRGRRENLAQLINDAVERRVQLTKPKTAEDALRFLEERLRRLRASQNIQGSPADRRFS